MSPKLKYDHSSLSQQPEAHISGQVGFQEMSHIIETSYVFNRFDSILVHKNTLRN